MREEVLNQNEAWDAYRSLRTYWRIGYLDESARFPELWDAYTPTQISSPNLWTDAYLCALCQATQSSLVTFDSKIPNIHSVELVKLAAAPEG